MAAGSQAPIGDEDNGVDALDDATLFVIGNTLFTVYHEFGHALIDLLKLPVIGREEDAVDGFAAVTMIPTAPDPLHDALIIAVADAWRLFSDLAAGGGPRAYWGEHALDEQRHFAIVCLLVGSDQEGFYDFALEEGLPEERIETCDHDFERMKSGWKRLLDPHRPEPEMPNASTAGPAAPPIDLIFEQPKPAQKTLYHRIRRSGILENAVLRLSDDIHLPEPVTVRFSACEDANAYWSPSENEVIVCYGLIDAFEAILLGQVMR